MTGEETYIAACGETATFLTAHPDIAVALIAGVEQLTTACQVYDGCADGVAEGIAEQEHDRLCDIAAENAKRAQFGEPPVGCAACGARDLLFVESWIYGSDADGRRGVRIPAFYECNMCGESVRA